MGLLYIYIVIQLFLACVLIRNFWVLSTRSDLIWNNLDEFEKLPSYNKMMIRFWVWDIEKFKKQKRS